MRVLQITNYFPPHYVGGAEVMVHNTCHGLLQRGVEAAVLAINGRMPQARDHYHDVEGVPVHEVTSLPYLLDGSVPQTFDHRVYQKVLAELHRFQPDLVHIHNVSGASLAPFLACRRLRVPVVLTLHDLWLLCPNNMLYQGDGTLCDVTTRPRDCSRCFRRYDFWANIPRRREVFARLVENVRLIVSPSQKLIDLHTAAGYGQERFRLVPNGIKPALFQVPSDPFVREAAAECGSFRTLLFAGAMVETKGIQTLIQALPKLTRYLGDLRLLIAGTGEERYTRALRSFEPFTVRLLGRVPFHEMRALYAASDLTLVPSTCHENSPMVIYESLMAGTPILGSTIGGIPELIQEGRTGYLFSTGDPDHLVERTVQHFALSAHERRFMRQRCAEYAQHRLTLDLHLDRLQMVYAEALET
jgi:glycosyltransferase involved in cell wall biosynthesis